VSELIESRDECVVLTGTVALMRVFARMMMKNHSGGEKIPDELFKLTCLSMVSQIEVDLDLHPETRKKVEAFEGNNS
jgi:hypothetical protein